MLSMPIRMRVAPTLKHVIMDTITYSEDTFAAQEATADSCLDFVNKVRHLVNTKGLTQRQLIDELKKSNISFRGKAVGDQGVRCIQTVEPYAVSGAVRGAARALEQVTKKLNEQTTMYKLCAACNKQYGKASQAAIDACTKVLITLRIALKYKDIETEYHITEEFLSGKSMKVSGFVQILFKKWFR